MAFQTLTFDDGGLRLLDQRALPSEVRYLVCRSAEETADAIRTLVVRGAPAIGVAAAFGMVLAGQRALASGASIEHALENAGKVLAGSRPTAVNLFWALDQMRGVQRSLPATSGEALVSALLERARKLLGDDLFACHAIGDFGAALLPEPARVLTHCNAGGLATAGYGTALGVIRSAHKRGTLERVFTGETRPVLQGARLTAWELVNDRIPTTLITDSMAGFLMARGRVNCVVVGADRITANGDVVNKIGTYSLAVLAREHKIPFFVAAPRSTFDLATPSGADVPIEERDPNEVLTIAGIRMAPLGVDVFNPAFDVTPAALVSAIACEVGVAWPPFDQELVRLLALSFDSPKPEAPVR